MVRYLAASAFVLSTYIEVHRAHSVPTYKSGYKPTHGLSHNPRLSSVNLVLASGNRLQRLGLGLRIHEAQLPES